MDDEHLVFLSYASQDLDRVRPFNTFLRGTGINVWFDKDRLRGGQNWDFELKRALNKAAIIVVFVSENSVDKRGYVQRELRIALDQARERLIDDIYLIPVLLDEGAVIPDQLKTVQAISGDDERIKADLSESIATQFERIGVEVSRVQGESSLRWTSSEYRDEWQGIPGYETVITIPRFSSDTYQHVSEISDVIRGWALATAMGQRSAKYEQSPDFYDFGQDKSRRQNLLEASYSEIRVKDRFVTIPFSVWTYSGGAAHPNQYFKTFAFTLDPVTELSRLSELFEDEDASLKVIASEARAALLGSTFDGMSEGEAMNLDKEWVESGTQDWSDFSNFVLIDDGLDLLFSPYQVAPYAFGPQFARVPYEKLVLLMKRQYRNALGIEHLKWRLESEAEDLKTNPPTA